MDKNDEFSLDDIEREIGIRNEICADTEADSKIIDVIFGIVMKSQDTNLKLKVRKLLNEKIKISQSEKDAIIDLINNSPIKSDDEIKGIGTYSGIKITNEGNLIIQDASDGHNRINDHNTILSIVYDAEKDKVVETKNKGKEVLVYDQKGLLMGVREGFSKSDVARIIHDIEKTEEYDR